VRQVDLLERPVSMERLYSREPARSVEWPVPWFPSALVVGQAAEPKSRRREVPILGEEPEPVEGLLVQVTWGSQVECLVAAQVFVELKQAPIQSGLEVEDQSDEPKVVSE